MSGRIVLNYTAVQYRTNPTWQIYKGIFVFNLHRSRGQARILGQICGARFMFRALFDLESETDPHPNKNL